MFARLACLPAAAGLLLRPVAALPHLAVVSTMIDKLDELNRVHSEAKTLLDGGEAEKAIAYADALDATPQHLPNLKQLRAVVYTDGGAMLARRDFLERGVALWKDLSPDERPNIGYNLANAELSLWQLAVRRDGWLAAWNRERTLLHAARDRYDRVANDSAAPDDLRARALTNCGNAYDGSGRELDAIDRYRGALAFDPDHGMALGNLGIALLRAARHMGVHAPTVLRQGIVALDAALEKRDAVIRDGGPKALRDFERERAKWKIAAQHVANPPGHDGNWADPHLRWCLRNHLFLHVSHECLHEDSPRLDPLYFQGLVVGFDPADQKRLRDLVDAFNTLKQDYIAARYSAWLASDRESPVREQSTRVAERVYFGDSLAYARWGLRTGMATQAFAAGTNVLDKVATFVHLYVGRSRRRPDFRTLAAPYERGKPSKPVDEKLAALLGKPEENRGLMALCDLSSDLEKPTPLSHLLELRHAATHRFLVAHTEVVPESDDWLERIRWGDLKARTIEQLRVARAALVYLARLIDIHEKRNGEAEESSEGKVRPTLPLMESDSRLFEYD
jgi:tetratricopeptide (TPR) repeat protein